MSPSATCRSSVEGPPNPAALGGWVFAYGSLMWHWPWPCRVRHRALLQGYRRAACLASVVYRGTPQAPGVGLGLVPGGECVGLAFGVDAADWPAVRRAVDERELVTGAYDRIECKVRMLAPQAESALAVAYVARTDHPQYLAATDEDELVRRIAFAQGSGGACFDYWRETLSTLATLGIDEPALARLLSLAATWRAGPAPLS